MSPLNFGVSLQQRWPLDDAPAAFRAARHAEDLGFDHVAAGQRLLEGGYDADIHLSDPLVMLSALAAATTRIRLLTSVLVMPYYPPTLLASQAATLDFVSGGRLILGVGTGWMPADFDAVGVSLRERGSRTDDHLGAVKALWTQRPANFDGRFTTLRDAQLGMPLVTPGGPPVWVGGHSDTALRRALRFGDAWYVSAVDADELTGMRRRLREAAADTGDADRVTITSIQFLSPPGFPGEVPSERRPLGGRKPTAASVVDDLGRLAEAGLTVCTLWLPSAEGAVEKAMDWVATEVMPQLT
ncbi:TIGR03619 family F420-dependent LLM class oxidoreductase [Streptomyces sp. bgisy034]|uniref:TIGR03619 family F420-dependent LLM class oxidoreductase n=1 Tax=Streptomyces sp. bgisy034 TaxID=3413774 RepID=UPI003EC0D231